MFTILVSNEAEQEESSLFAECSANELFMFGAWDFNSPGKKSEF